MTGPNDTYFRDSTSVQKFQNSASLVGLLFQRIINTTTDDRVAVLRKLDFTNYGATGTLTPVDYEINNYVTGMIETGKPGTFFTYSQLIAQISPYDARISLVDTTYVPSSPSSIYHIR